MATRSGVAIDLIWVLVSLSHARINDVLSNADTLHKSRIADAVLSVNRNVAGTQALVKVAATAAQLIGSLPTPARAAILRIFTEADFAEAVALVSTVEWAGEPAGEP